MGFFIVWVKLFCSTISIYAPKIRGPVKQTTRAQRSRSWDIVPYMATAEMKLKQGHKQIGRASYDVSGFDLIHKGCGLVTLARISHVFRVR